MFFFLQVVYGLAVMCRMSTQEYCSKFYLPISITLPEI